MAAAAITPWHRAALVDRFLRPRIAAGTTTTTTTTGLQLSPFHDLPVSPYDSAFDVARFERDAGAYAAGLAGFVHDADAYAAAPEELASAHAPGPGPGPRPRWYFLSPTGNRLASLRGGGGGGGFPGKWVPQRHDMFPEKAAAAGGTGTGTVRHARRFFYVDKESPKTPTGWMMVENSITRGQGRRPFGRQEKLVLCELYKCKPRHP